MKRIAWIGLAYLAMAGTALATAPCDGTDCGATQAAATTGPAASANYTNCLRQATERHLIALDKGTESSAAARAWKTDLNECRRNAGVRPPARP